jgi:hypothetical protein
MSHLGSTGVAGAGRRSFTMLGLEISYDSETKIADKGHEKGGKDEPR